MPQPMNSIAFLLGDTRIARNDNHERLPEGFAAAGWAVSLLPQESIRLDPGGVLLGTERADRFDLIWPLGLGRVATFFDRMQLLRQVPQDRFVTRVDALVYLHAKYRWWRFMPETYASNDAGYLMSVLRRGGQWVLKPSAGSYGRDVQLVTADQSGEAAVERLTAGGTYCFLQRFVPAVRHGEKRTLVAGGRVIGSYLRLADGSFRSNLALGAHAQPTALDDGERALVETIAAELVQEGVGYAAVDTVYPYLIEVNLANPGGLSTLTELYGRDDFAQKTVAAVAAAHGLQAGAQ
jgi:glutathione synthase